MKSRWFFSGSTPPLTMEDSDSYLNLVQAVNLMNMLLPCIYKDAMILTAW
jgi:hypothetical protein